MKKLIFLVLVNVFALSSIADTQKDDDFEYHYNYGNSNGCSQVYDPYEKFNRKIFAFNSVLDRLLLRPITIGYRGVTNDYTKARVSSFLDNITAPVTIINYGLQGNYDQTMKSLWRFLINSTFGVAGLFDVASKVGLKVKKQTFGSTLARYGVAPGPYIVLPFIGGTNMRDITDSTVTNYYMNPVMYEIHRDASWTIMAVQIIDTRLAVLPFTDYVQNSSTDPYISIRSATHQNRESMVSYPKQFKCPTKPINQGI